MAHASSSLLQGNPVRSIRANLVGGCGRTWAWAWEEHASPRSPAPRAPNGTDVGTFSQPPGWGLNTARGEADFREMVNAWPESKHSSLSPSAQSAQSAASTMSPSTPNPARLAVRRENPAYARRSAVRPGVCARRRNRLPSLPRHARATPSPTVFLRMQFIRPTCIRSFLFFQALEHSRRALERRRELFSGSKCHSPPWTSVTLNQVVVLLFSPYSKGFFKCSISILLFIIGCHACVARCS